MGMIQSKTLWTIGFGVGALTLLYGPKLFRKLNWRRNGSAYRGKPIRGLKNIGSTCYLNAVLQAFSACTYLNNWLATKDDQNRCDFPPRIHNWSQYKTFDYPMIAVMYRAMLVINRVIGNDEEDNYLMKKIPRDIIRTLQSENCNFVDYQEQDTYECMIYLLSALQAEVTKSIERRQLGSVDCILDEDDASEVSGELISVSEIESDVPSSTTPIPHPRLSFSEPAPGWDVVHDPKKAVNGIYSKRKSNLDAHLPSILTFPFKGMTANVLQCVQCMYKTPVRFETFDALTLTMPRVGFGISHNVGSLIVELQKPVIVTNVNCAGCTKRQGKPTKSVFSKTMYFARLPQILCLHILQCEWGAEGLAKRTEYVRYSEHLTVRDLQHWCNAITTNVDAWDVLSSGDMPIDPLPPPRKADKVSYDLKACIAHYGDAESGHFVTCRRIPDTPDNINISRWAIVSDENVMSIGGTDPFNFKPYLLFFEKSLRQNGGD